MPRLYKIFYFLKGTQMEYSKVKEDNYKLTTSLDEVINTMESFKNELFGKQHPLIINNNTISNIQRNLFLANYIVNDFLKTKEDKLIESKPLFISVVIDGRLYTISLGVYSGTFLYSIDS